MLVEGVYFVYCEAYCLSLCSTTPLAPKVIQAKAVCCLSASRGSVALMSVFTEYMHVISPLFKVNPFKGTMQAASSCASQ
jgi:hypothetical protein